ncbi:MAG: FmdB family zinc ribbon protein [Phycisphaerales bacterium]
MPTYEYRCTACKHQFEQFQSMRDKALTKCPACGAKALERLIGTGAAVIFKGGGFYQTDYRSESYKKAAEADAKSASPTTAEPEKKTDSGPKPEPAAGPSVVSKDAPAPSKEKPATRKRKKP